MNGTIIGFLNSSLDLGISAAVIIAWFALWHLILKRMLRKSDVTSFWYELYELGAFGSLGIMIFLLLIVALIIASVHAVIGYGPKMIFPLALFWGAIITGIVLIVRYIIKKK